MTDPLATFDVCGPLPTGTTLLEASAGTGKTFTVGALVARYVAEGVAELDEMLVITFGRAASQELRERVRSQLVEAERVLGDPGSADPHNSLLSHLLDADEEERAVRRARLRDALAAFDAATIATTHQFCQLVLRSLGVAGDTDAGSALVESLDELVVEVVDDLYLQLFGASKERPPFGRDTALALARTAVGDPQSALAEVGEGAPATAVARREFAVAVRAEIERRKRRLGVLSYDDLLSRLADALADEDAPARARMRQRWRIVLVDEFQDTDPVQWDVLDRAFTGHATMVLIGDPKQAIYAFRGGDVVTYLAAARTATHRATLGTNWRSDDGLVRSLLVPLGSAALGNAEIVVRDVTAHHRGGRLSGAPRPAPFRVRRVPRDGFKLNKAGLIGAADARAHVAEDCAADIAALLDAGATWCGERLRAGQIAVIVAVRDHGQLVKDALERRGVPAVLAGGGDVFLTTAGEEWLSLLAALEAPHRSALVRAAALTCFFGHSAVELDEGGETLTARVADTLRGWALLLRGRGVAALVEAAEERGLTRRVLARTGGERLLTDLRHLGQLLHEMAVREDLGLTALLEWFRDERRRTAASERPRRLDSDAAAVQIVTVHGSKGLEYPVTYLPFAYQLYQFPVDVARFHDAAGRRTLDVSGAGPQWNDHARLHQGEELGEELRDLYVALTRAQSQVVTWWAPTSNTAAGGLHRLLFGRQPGIAEVPDQQQVGDDDYAARVLALIEELGGPAAEVSVVAEAVAERSDGERAELAVRTFDREVDVEWRRTSYSGLIRADETGGHGAVTSEPEQTGREDEDQPESATDGSRHGRSETSSTAGEPLVSPMADLPAGATFGSLVHAVLEHADPDAPDLETELLAHVREQLRWWYVAAAPEDIAAALVPVVRTPLGPLAGGLTLAEIPLRDRLRELDFELPLDGGDRSRHGRFATSSTTTARDVRLREVAPLLRQHLPADDPLAPYAATLEQPALGDQALRGYLAGSVDVLLRVADGDEHRYVVVDYKTNRLGPADEPGTAADYGPRELAQAMLHSHYPLQALLYSVVAHRFLRWRVPGYDPERHLGGVLYLYLRGMCGPETPVTDGHPAGVFSWSPPTSLVLALSDLLDGVPAGGAA
ncbi:UvrD-helicase domain-containing protein [Nocardioides panacisoli]|uniref:UvrD-helicase domain-containing protein n=1 Tax=Nocardioides panacisoli TaxID=627624 RepID=UPI0031D605E8